MSNNNLGDHKHLIDRLAIINAFVTAVALFPQAYIAFFEGAAGGLSITTFFLIFLNSSVWFLYASHQRIIPLLVSSFLNIIASMFILVAIVMYKLL